MSRDSRCRVDDVVGVVVVFLFVLFFFFFQAEDGIRDVAVTGVQTCALPIYNKRNTFNALSNTLTPNNSNAEDTGTDRADFLSQGVKIRTTSGAWNASGATYIYMAFAEHPFVSSTGTPVTAR